MCCCCSAAAAAAAAQSIRSCRQWAPCRGEALLVCSRLGGVRMCLLLRAWRPAPCQGEGLRLLRQLLWRVRQALRLGLRDLLHPVAAVEQLPPEQSLQECMSGQRSGEAAWRGTGAVEQLTRDHSCKGACLFS